MTRWVGRCIGGLRGFRHDGRIDLGGSGSVVELLVSHDYGDGIQDDCLQLLRIIVETLAIEIIRERGTGDSSVSRKNSRSGLDMALATRRDSRSESG